MKNQFYQKKKKKDGADLFIERFNRNFFQSSFHTRYLRRAMRIECYLFI